MKEKAILFVIWLFLPHLIGAQAFKISVENTPSTFTQFDPKLYVTPNQTIIITWKDNRTGVYHAFGQWFNIPTLQKSGTNFPFWGNENLFCSQDSFLVSVKYLLRQGGGVIPDSYYYLGRLYHGNKVLPDSFLIAGGWVDECGMGDGHGGFNYQILFFKHGLLEMDCGDSQFWSVRYDYRLNRISSPNRYSIYPLNFTASAFGNERYGLAFVNDYSLSNLDSVYALYFALFDSKDSLVYQPKKILELPDLKSHDLYYNALDFVPLASISLNDSTMLVAFWNAKERMLHYFRAFQSGRIDSVKLLPLEWSADRSERKLRFMPLKDGQVRLIFSARDPFVNAFYDFTPTGNFTGNAIINSSLNILLNNNGVYFDDNDAFYAPFYRNGDVFLGHYKNFVLQESIKVNDDVSGSNEILENVLPKGEHDFCVLYNKKEKKQAGRFVRESGIPQGEEVDLGSATIAFFRDGSHVRLWKHTIYRDMLGFSIYDNRNQLIVQDTLTTNVSIGEMSVTVLKDQSFVLVYHNFLTDRTALTVVSSDGNIKGTVSFSNKTSPYGSRVFQMKNGNCWLVWDNKGIEFSAQPVRLLSDVRGFPAPVALVFDPGLFLLEKKQEIGGIYYQAALVTNVGDTLTPTFPIGHVRIYRKPFLLKLNELEFLSLYTFDKKIMANVYNLNGVSENENMIICAIDSGLVGNPMAAVNDEKVLFAWHRTGRSGCGYDVDGIVLPLNQFTAVEEGKGEQPFTFRLQQNYPNPFNSATAIEFYLPQRSYTQLTVYNLLGQRIRTLAEATFAAGNHRVIWDGRNNQGSMVPSGIYFCRMKAGAFTANLKMLFVR